MGPMGLNAFERAAAALGDSLRTGATGLNMVFGAHQPLADYLTYQFQAKDAHELDLQYQAERYADERAIAGWRMKLYELLDCHYCMSVYVGAGAVALTDWQTSVPLPVWAWLCASAGAVVIWEWTEQ